MAHFTKRQLITALSVVYLLALTILAAYALHQATILSLPIPEVLSALTVALPALAGIALEILISFQYRLSSKQGTLTTAKVFQVVSAFFLVYETVVATLAGTHIAPVGGLWCPLHDRWQALYRSKDAEHIRRIQDAFSCCGFESVKDMAWPFPDRHHGVGTCVQRFERETACLEPWRAAERRVAIILLVIPLAVFLWKGALFLAPGFDTHWLPSTIRLPNDRADNNSGRPRPAITYRDIEEDGEADSLRREVNALNKDSNLATHIEGGRVRPSPLIQEAENNMWRHD